ncbi:MAG: DEAD/DEAH box helicase, partial [Planctomycetales bacterium]|nr:DEAD/DEAH box helicase [Planctomycetales bacterium]
DLFAADWEEPVRVELFGDEIESLRVFDVATQRSMGTVDGVELSALRVADRGGASLADHLPAGTWLVLVEPAEIDAEARRYLERNDRPEGLFAAESLWQTVDRFPHVALEALAEAATATSYRLPVESVTRFSGEIGRVRDELDGVAADGNVSIVCQTKAEAERLGELLGETKLARAGRLHFPLGRLHEGFRWLPDRTVLIGANELFHRSQRPQPRRHQGQVIDSFLDLRAGDYVVHVGHGVGRYRGMKLLEKQNHAEEHLELEFRDHTKLFVPVSKIALVQKYVGGTKTRPTLAKIGGRTWERKKAAVAECVNDMAVELLEVQAARSVRPGISFSHNSAWQREFEASFPYEETADQLTAIGDIHNDMSAARPMDRLICGDVGYGKTELAMRSAFQAVDSGYQVGVLVPTTVLAEQHLRTFSERMSEFPVTIDVLSRFRSRKQQTEVLKRLSDGKIDIVVGTHRLAQRDVRFQNLGLLIIDEEQRFGVEIKERLKALRKTVDVLTLTATPIPRTLHMSLVGLRDISNLETPPEDRLAVETRVTRFSPELVRHAILRELNRGGQAFFVHNRVQDIEA